jgi:hypothetical protein
MRPFFQVEEQRRKREADKQRFRHELLETPLPADVALKQSVHAEKPNKSSPETAVQADKSPQVCFGCGH